MFSSIKMKQLLARSVLPPHSRSFKNFGHKRQPIPGITILWHGFLTFTFIGLGMEWKSIARFMLGDDEVNVSFDPTDAPPKT